MVATLLGSNGKMATQGCPCGFFGDPVRPCTCSPSQVSRYAKRISGPMLDRIDIFVDVPRVDCEKLGGPAVCGCRGHAARPGAIVADQVSGRPGYVRGFGPDLKNRWILAALSLAS